jgi:hypothetical protein
MKGRMNSEYGEIIINPEVIATYAGSVAVECFGIVGMGMISMKDGLTKLLKRESLSKGVEVTIEDNQINIYFKESRTASDIYKSFAHEEKHALQFHLSNRDLDTLSTFEKETSIAHKLSFCYNIDDDLDLPSIQYLYNYNELDSKVEEIQELLNFIKNDIEHPDRYKSILRDILEFCEIYNKQDFKEYQKWLINHYEKHRRNPEGDPHCVMPSVIKMEKKFNINIRHFIKNTFDDLHKNKYQQLILLRRELSKLFNIIQQPPEKRDVLLEKYKEKELKKIHNFINNEER